MNTYPPSMCGTFRCFGEFAELLVKDGIECLKMSNNVIVCSNLQSGKSLSGDHKSVYATQLKEYNECEKREGRWNAHIEKNIKK